MIITEHISGAISSIISNKLRAGLSMLGIIIGVFSIIVMMALGQGTTSSVVEKFNSMGANLITISVGGSSQGSVGSISRGTSSDLIDDNFVEFVKNIYGVKNVSPTASASKQFIYGTYNTNGSLVGVLPIYAKLKNLTVSNGEFITDDDVKKSNKVVVIGYTIAEDGFNGEDPVGKEIKLENGVYTVIGVLADNSQTNRRIFLPITTVMQKISGSHFYSSLDVEVNDADKVAFMKTFIEDELVRYTGVASIDDAAFSVSTMSEMLTSIQEVTGTLTKFLAGIAAISLIVGGIGVMNIMLVSVTERTREIGIRKALGAFKSDILMQFLIEAMIISIIAGLIGIGLSYLTVAILNNFIKSVITTNSIMLSFGSVVLIGIVFGILPASKASNLKPIDALRYE